MDEVRKSQALIKMILERANSISSTMTDVNQRLTDLNLKMEAPAVKEPAAAPLRLLDLHPSILANIVNHLADPKALSALGMSCRAMSELTSTYDWRRLCLLHWGITQSDPRHVRCMDSALIHGYAKIDKHGDSSVVWEQRMRGNPWRNVYRDRTYGWRVVVRMLRWLRMHNHPVNVSGVSHRFQLYLALQYMGMCTCSSAEAERKAEIIQYAGIPSLLALLRATHPAFKEAAASVLANLMYSSPSTKEQVLLDSSSGKTFSDALGMEFTGVTQHMSRALLNMWADGSVPQVKMHNAEGELMLPLLESGSWCLQEYSLRGEAFRSLTTVLSFNEYGQLSGLGTEYVGNEEAEEFSINGYVENGRKWEFVKEFSNQHRVIYKGHSDAFGAYGVYYPFRANNSSRVFLVSGETAPKVFRLFRDEGVVGAAEGDAEVGASELLKGLGEF
mmetsp:Transcript_31465/g.56333  ORF Transcript_31465/g.56333 Transcript_31465/m.56333 type:complete len:445 (-) Transcript_31465:189-1523(-)